MRDFLKRCLLLLSALFVLVSCSGAQTVDDQFFVDLHKAWQERTALLQEHAKEQEQGQDEDESIAPFLRETYNTEWEALKDYEDKDFKDEALQKQVHQYLSALRAINADLDGDFTLEKNKAFNEHYKMRVAALQAINEDSRSTLPADQIDDLEINEDAIKEAEDLQKRTEAAADQFQKDLNDLQLEVKKQPTQEDPSVELEGTLTNHSDMIIKNLDLIFHFADEDGNDLATDEAKIDSFQPDETQTFTIQTDKLEYDHLEIELGEQLEIVPPEEENETEK